MSLKEINLNYAGHDICWLYISIYVGGSQVLQFQIEVLH